MINVNKIFKIAITSLLLFSAQSFAKEVEKVEDTSLKCFFSMYDAELEKVTIQENSARKDGIEESELTELSELRNKMKLFNTESKKLKVGNLGAMKKVFPSFYNECAPKVISSNPKS